MANRRAGEVEIGVDGRRLTAKLTLGALAELEDRLQAESLVGLVGKFESGAFKARDVLEVLAAGLRGGGWNGDAGDLAVAELEGGPIVAARAAAELLALAFHIPD